MADDITASLAPWMQGNTGDASSYGGLGQLGLNLLANSNTPGRFGSIFGRSALGAQQQAMQDAAARMGLVQQGLQMGLTKERLQAMQDYANDPGAQPQGAPGQPGLPQQAVPGMPPGMAPGLPLPGMSPQNAQPQTPSTPFDVPQADIYSTPISGHSAQQFKRLQLAFGKDPGEAETITRKIQLENAQAAVKPRIELLDQVVKSDKAAQMASASPQLQQLWSQTARQYGFNPLADYNDANVRRVFSARRNELAAWAQLPTEAPPNQLTDVTGSYGYRGQKDPITGKETQVQGRDLPSYTLKDAWNPQTNTQQAIPVQTGGWGMGGINPVSGSTTSRGGVAGGKGAQTQVPQQPKGVDLGYKPPDDQNLKSAMFASEMRAGLQRVQSMENTGFTLPPKVRAALIDVATSDSDSIVKQFLSQEALAHGLTKDQQTYIAGLMPILQAIGHSQAGARLTTGQIRQNMESVVPIDTKNTDALTQVNQNRKGFYTGVLTQAGSALQLPQYKDTLGNDLAMTQSTRKTLGGKTYVSLGNGRWAEAQ